MAYNKTFWKDEPSTETSIDAEKLNKIEQGIYNAHESIDKLPDWVFSGDKPSLDGYTKAETDALLDKKANAIINTATGETVVTTDSANATPSIELFGKSEQVTYQGNQLLNLPNVDSLTLGNKITWSCKDGVVTAKGNTTSITNTGGYIYQHMPIVAGNYFVSGDGKYAKVFCKITKQDGSTAYYYNRAFTLDGTETDVFVYVAIQNDGLNVDINETIYPMVNKGTTALTFEPYVGGEASPNLNYPQDVHCIGESNQLLDYQRIYEANSKRIAIDGENILYTYNGAWQYCDTLVTLPQGTYTISAESIPNEVTIYVSKSDKNTVLRSIYGTSKVGTFENTEEAVYIRITSKVAPSKETTDIIKKLMLNEGTKALHFEQYGKGSIEQKFLTSNLLYIPDITKTESGITLVVENGVLKASGTCTHASQTNLGLYGNYGDVSKVALTLHKGTYVIKDAIVSHWDGTTRKFYYPNQTIVVDDVMDFHWVATHVYKAGQVVNETLYPRIVLQEDTPFEPYSEQVLVHQTPNGLHGQGDVADVIDYGQGKRITRFIKIPFLPTYDWRKYDTNFAVYNLNLNVNVDGARQMCNACHNFKKSGWKADVPQFAVADNYIRFVPNGFTDMTLEDFKARLEESEVYAICEMAEPIVTDLTEEELAQYSNVHMNYPNTTIVNSDSAYTEVEYVADTKCYIDKKFKELEVALANTNAQLL